MGKVIGAYKNGNYLTFIEEDGTKTRYTSEDEFYPAFAENCDVCITKKCSQNCAFCYEGCTSDGCHADLLNQEWVNTLHPYTELALNGNDLDHPQLIPFLIKLKELKVIANITVNQNQFMKNIDTIKDWCAKEYIHGVGISLIDPTPMFIEAVKEFPNAVIHTINGILTKEQVETLCNHNLKMLILGYKDIRRGESYHKANDVIIKANQQFLYDNLEEYLSKFNLISFDNLALKQLDAKRFISPEEWETIYMGDDGSFTFYIDMVARTFAKNSLSMDRFPIKDSVDEMFKIVKG